MRSPATNMRGLPFAMLALSSALQIHCSQYVFSEPSCTNYDVTVQIDRTTRQSFDNGQYGIEILYALAGRETLVSNVYNLSSRLCEPAHANAHSGTLQLLLHGASFNKGMWDSEYMPETYSWVRRMNREGYPTLAVDLIGNGNSTFPDGLLEAQTQAYVETVHHLVQLIRDGAIEGRRWDNIVLVGFSIGAIVGNSLAEQYPADLDGILLHGISWDSSWIYPSFLSGLQAPAAQIDPSRWGHIPVTYQTQSTREGRIAACFGGSYDENVLEYDWNTRDFDTLGAAMTFVYHLVEAPNYGGPVFLGIGDREVQSDFIGNGFSLTFAGDATFCGGKFCGSQPYALYDKFPQAKEHEVKVYPETGHLILFHHAAQDLLVDSLAFLKKHGF